MGGAVSWWSRPLRWSHTGAGPLLCFLNTGGAAEGVPGWAAAPPAALGRFLAAGAGLRGLRGEAEEVGLAGVLSTPGAFGRREFPVRVDLLLEPVEERLRAGGGA